MKKITLFLLLVCIASIATAQDILVKNDKTELKVKVLEITDVTIKYKKFEMLDGPTYAIKKTDVFMIIYQNGSKEYMETIPAPVSPKPTTTVGNNAMNTMMNQNETSTTTSATTPQKQYSKKQRNFNVQVALLNTTASLSDDISATSVTRMRAGFYYRVPIATNISFEPGVHIVGKGSKLNYFSGSYRYDEEINCSYIELPLNLVYTSGGNSGFVGGIAPTISVLIAKSDKGTATNYSTGYTSSFNNTPNFKSTETGILLTAGYRFSPQLAITLIYNNSLTNISNEYVSYQTSYLGINAAIGL